jgi:2-hydroxychromene-2-carboxylate isomerase
MSRHMDVYYALSSPWTYLAFPRLLDLERRPGVTATYKPVRLGKVFEATGGLPLPRRSPERRAYRLMELRRWRDRLGLPLTIEPRHFPVDDGLAARMVIAHRLRGGDPGPLSLAILRALWVEERDIADPATLADIAGVEGLDGGALLAAADSPEVAAAYDSDTEEAIRRGVFGAPTVVIGEEVFWGQDRLDFVAEALGTSPAETRTVPDLPSSNRST